MTQPDLFNPPAPAIEKPKRTRAKVSLVEQVAEIFRTHPHQWIDGHRFGFAGYAGWSARIRDLRKPPPLGKGWTIENRVRHWHDPLRVRPSFAITEYRYVPVEVDRTCAKGEEEL